MTTSLTESVTKPSRLHLWLRRLAWCEPFWVAALGLLLLLPPRFLPTVLQIDQANGRIWLVLLLLLGWPVRRLAYGTFSRRTPLNWPMLILIIWLPVNMWASVDQALSWEALGYLLLGVAMYFALLNWPPTQQRPQLIAWVLLLLGGALTLATPLLTELAIGKIFRLPGLDNLFQQAASQVPGNVNANRVAGALVVIAPLAVALGVRWDWTKRRWAPILCGLLALAMLVMLILTQSRNAYLAMAIAIGVILLLRWPKLLWLLPVALVLAAVVVWRVGLSNLLEALLSGGAWNGLDGRLELWSRAIYAINDFPFTGIGLGTFEKVIPVLYPLFSIGPDTVITHAHNLWLQVAVDLGLPGLIAYLAMFINVFVVLWQVLRRRTVALDWTLAVGTLGAILALLIHGIFDAPLWGVKPAFIPWLFIALAMLLGSRAEQARRDSAPAP